MSVKDRLEGRVIKPGINVKVNELVSREFQYSVRDVRDGSVARVACGAQM